MRVFVVIDSFSFGGAENLLAVLAGAAPSAGLELQVMSLAPRSQGRNSFQPLIEQAGLSTGFLDVPRLAYPPAIPRIAREIRASGCDVVHAHLGYSAILAPIAARLAGRPCVSTLHHVPGEVSVRDHVKEWMSVTVSGRLGNLVFVSQASREAFANRFSERPERWRTVYNGVDLAKFSPGAASWPAKLPIRPGTPVVTIVAALRRPKGHRVAVEAWRSVVDRVPDATLLIVGDGDQRRPLERQVDRLGLGANVVFAGASTRIPDLLRASTLVALPSLTEALPTSLIEAAACGKAVVAANVGGVPEVVDDGKTGLLVEPQDVEGFADAVTTLLVDEVRRAEMERAARRAAEQRFDMHAWAAQLRDLYEGQLAG